MQRFGIIAFSALAYYVCGKLGIFLAIPPGYATAVWPSSGVALAVVIRYGAIAFPGVWLGSYFINLGIANAFQNPSVVSILFPALIALGAVAQAELGRRLVQPFVTQLWSNLRAILYILLLGGPLSCLLAASVGVTTLLLFEQITPNLYGTIWITWWIGDSLGVLAFTPALLVLLVSPATVSPSKRLTVIAPLVIMFLLVTIAYMSVRDFEELQRRERVVSELGEIRLNIEQELENTLEMTRILAAYFANNDAPPLHVFNAIAQEYMAMHPSFRAL